MTIYIGYPDFDAFTREIDWLRPVYVALYTEPGASGQFGLRTDTHYVHLAQPVIPDDTVHYFRFKVGSITLLNGSPFDEAQVTEDIIRAKTAHGAIAAWLELNDFTIKNAVIAWPKDLCFLDGNRPTVIKYDADTRTYVLAADAPA